jgi:uncharacterized protein (TIGR02246 family)
MKNIILIAALVIVSTFAAFAQTSKDEQEILKIHNGLDQAFLKKDIAPFERVMADDYVYSNPYGKMMNRAESLEDMRKEFANTNYKVVSGTNAVEKVKISGNMALVTGNWTFTSIPANDANAEPHKDTGRYTGVYEKRGGKWLLIAEHFSEAPHDRKLMEQQVLKMGQEYTKIIKNQDAAAIERILADEYTYTNERGKVKNKAEDVASYKTPTKFEIFDITDQKVRVIGNNAAVETGTVRFKGADKDGKPFDGSKRYTTTWVWRDGRWQVVADHTSEIKQ